MVLLAGPAAEAYFVEVRRDAQWDAIGASADIEKAVGLLERLGGHEDETTCPSSEPRRPHNR
jgi:hypothetical protein